LADHVITSSQDNVTAAATASLAVCLAHERNNDATGSVFVVEPCGGISKLRWERAKGIFMNPDTNFTLAALATKWHHVGDFTEKSYPTSAMDFGKLLPQMQAMPPNDPFLQLPSFRGKVVIVTGGASG
jgi:hypothetical protein